MVSFSLLFNPIALRKAKIAYNFGLSVCNRVKKPHTNSSSVAYCVKRWPVKLVVRVQIQLKMVILTINKIPFLTFP